MYKYMMLFCMDFFVSGQFYPKVKILILVHPYLLPYQVMVFFCCGKPLPFCSILSVLSL